MGLLDQLGGLLGGQEHIERMAHGQGNFADPNSDDHQRFGQMLGHADPQDLQAAISNAAKQGDPQEYADHVTPGVGGTDPLGAVGQGGLSTIASALLGSIAGHSGQQSGGGMLGGLLGGGGAGGGGGGFERLIGMIP